MKAPKTPSPWSAGTRCKLFAWDVCWALFCRWTPKPMNRWRLLWLRVFGARIEGRPFVHQRARIQIPWHLALLDGACVGDRANLYSLGQIVLEEGCIVAQEAYLCTGDHDLAAPGKPLVTKAIRVGREAFVGARAFVLPSVEIAEDAVVGAGSLVTRSLKPGERVAGNPARLISGGENCD